MRFSESFLRSLRARVSIVDYAGRRLVWHKSKTQPARGDYWACCPFHQEKSPSFHVLEAKGIFKCFGCGEAGDVINLAMKLEGYSFPEAVEKLAEQAGLPLPAEDRPADPQEADRRKRLFAALARAQELFSEALRGPDGRTARAYLERRGLPATEWERFGIGLAPGGWTFAIDKLTAAGFTLPELIGAGLAKPGQDGKPPIDVFRGRIIFPIADAQGRTIAFGGRALDPSAPAKYLNSPETELFHKSAVLYRLKEARAALARQKGDGLVVAEGYLDVIAFERADIPAVAPLGTALTEEQLALLWKSGPQPVLCFDGDPAGARAAERSLRLALPQIGPDRSVRIALMPSGQDPDDLFRTQGPAALSAILAQAQGAADRLFASEANRAPLDTPEARAALKTRLRQEADRIAHPETRKQYVQTLLSRADELLRAPAANSQQRQRRPGGDRPYDGRRFGGRFALPPKATPELIGLARARRSAAVEDLLRMAVDRPGLLEHGADALAAIPIADPELHRIRHALLDLWMANQPVDRTALNRHLGVQSDDRAQARLLRWPGKGANAGVPGGEAQAEAEWRAWVTSDQTRLAMQDDLDSIRREAEEDPNALMRFQELARAKRAAEQEAHEARDEPVKKGDAA